MSKDKTVLGKGLEVLFSSGNSNDENVKDDDLSTSNSNLLIDIEKIKVSPYQPREEFEQNALNELANSIRQKGVIQAITLRKSGEDEYELIAGERRLRAAKMAGLNKILFFILDVNSKEDILEMSLIENIQRSDLNAVEVAKAYQQLVDECDLKQEEIAEKVGKSRAVVSNYLRILRLPVVIQESIRKGEINEGHARQILSFDSENEQIHIWKKIKGSGLSVRKAEELSRTMKKKEKKLFVSNDQSKLAVQSIENRLREHFGTKVSVKPKDEKSGEIIIQYFNHEDLDRILDICK